MLTSRAIGQHCGIPERTIRDWQAKGIVPKTADLGVAVQAVIAHYKQQIREIAESSGDDDALKAEKIRLTRAQADKVELELSVRQGELVEARQTVLVWSRYLLACRSRLLGLPSKFAYELSGMTDPVIVQQILEEGVDEVLQELGSGEFVERLGAAEADDNSICTAEEIDDEPVGG
jgi:phage terminase Nu1 subunit (DNA packaging protein)